VIRLKNVCKQFENIKAVTDVSFSAEPGEIFGLIGPNGAGKSTTIRMIMNILAPDSGEIFVSGKPIAESDKSRIGYLPEERGLYKKMKVAETLRYFGSLKGKKQDMLDDRIEYWLKRVGLSEWKDRKVDELSKGMSQKIQFIVSILHDPDYLFFDEPFSGLDPVSTEQIKDIILEQKMQGKVVLFSTHIMDQAEKLCDKIFLINKGKEVLSGKLESLKSQYGSDTIMCEFDGDGGFLDTYPDIESINRYPRWVEITLKNPDAAGNLLKALAAKVHVKRFEICSPSLHSIFIDQVGGANGE
jgi:ABC-2 type transport system ATP-binding protein